MSADSLGTASRCALHVKILSRVPYRSLCCFKCISRSWLILCGSDPIRTSARNCLSCRRWDQPQLLPVPQSFWERPAAGLPLSWASHWFCPDSSASPAGFPLPVGTGPVWLVTGQTGPVRFRFGPVPNRPKFKIQIWIQKNEKFLKNS